MSDMSGPPLRADHVRSLPHAPEPLWAREQHQASRLPAASWTRRLFLAASWMLLLPGTARHGAGSEAPPGRLHFRRVAFHSGALR